MSNKVRIEPTEFHNTLSGSVEYGFRIYDDYENYYCDALERMPDSELALLAAILRLDSSSPQFEYFKDYIIASEPTLYFVGGNGYQAEDYTDVLIAYSREVEDEDGEDDPGDEL